MPLTDFISTEGQQRIARAIALAEQHTSGEICVHVTPKCHGDAMETAKRKFQELGLCNTWRRNAVLIYVAYIDRKFAILGDSGIDKAVPLDFWHTEKETLTRYLADHRQVDGLCEVVRQIGDSLAASFPASREDINELSNEVTYDEDDE